MVTSERELRVRMVEVGRWMWQRGFIGGTGGNLSVRLDHGRVLATPSGRAKGRLDPGDLVVVDLDGQVNQDAPRPSSEILIHLAAYRLRPDVGAVVHAHPEAVVAHTLSGLSLAPEINPEVLAVIGPVADVEYRAPGSAALVELLQGVLAHHNTFIIARHGTITLGEDLEQAYDRLEFLEQTARTRVMARSLGRAGHHGPLP